MLRILKHKLAIFTGKTLLLNSGDSKELEIGKRIVSVIAGAYIFQRGIRTIYKTPAMGVQELLLGGFLLYNGATGINALVDKKPKEISDVRKNQIQGNDPAERVPAFV